VAGPTATLVAEATGATPGVPEAPVVDEMVPNGATVTARLTTPTLPPGARYLRLQVRRPDEVAAAYHTWGEFTEGALVELWGLTPNANTIIRWVAIGDPGEESPGPEVGIMPAANQTQALLAPAIVAVGTDEIWVQPREVPAGAHGLTLQIKPQNSTQAIWVPVSLLPGAENQPLRTGYLWPGKAYLLRWVAQTDAGFIEGTPISITTRVAPQIAP
jgi:hypothetical protein